MIKTNGLLGTVLPVICFCLLANAAAGENWPRFRGPNGQGLSTDAGIPTKWAKDDLAWSIELPGRGHSSPVVWEDTVYITCADDETARGTLLAVSATNGEILWREDESLLKPLRMHPLNSHAASTPAVDAEGVCVIWNGGSQTLVIALNHKGEEQWRKDFGATANKHGAAASPVLHEDIVVFTQEQEENDLDLQSRWYALDRRSGEIRWQLERDTARSASDSTPCIFRSEDGESCLIFTSRTHGFTAVDPRNGAVLWEEPSAFPARVVAGPLIAGGLVISQCGQGGRGVQLSAIRPSAQKAGATELAYSVTGRSVPYVPVPLAHGKHVFLFQDGGTVSCLDASTGDVVWSEKPGGKFFGSPVVVEDRIYCIDTKGKIVVLKAGPVYERLAINDLGEPSQATPAIANGRMFLRTETRLSCIEAVKP